MERLLQDCHFHCCLNGHLLKSLKSIYNRASAGTHPLMKKLIVNADDFGLTEGTNRAIVDGHLNGVITSATLMANGSAFDDAVARAKGLSEMGVGVHLNLTDGQPVSPRDAIPSLLDGEGFGGSPVWLARGVFTGSVKAADIETELRSQIEKVAAAGIKITHLDCHKHVQMLPAIFRIVVRLAQHFNIRSLRCTVESAALILHGPLHRSVLRIGLLKQFISGRVLSFASRDQRRIIREAGLRCPDNFFGVTYTGFLDGLALESILRKLPQGTSELMCHPGYNDPALGHVRTRLRAQREEELRSLMAPEVKQLVAAEGIKLITYRDLSPD